ncbi:MAG: MFS transporter [Acidocella sp. 21-58-7]|nr:MAG: MFS transporter [Acidocella sp. 21-58-7]
MSALSFLDRERTVAPAGYNRWLVPPAALCIHLCIGQVYALSVFNLPLTKLIGLKASAPGDWTLADVGWIFSVAIAVLGISAAFGGRWLDRVGPRKAMTLAAFCFGGGFIVSSFGVSLHSLPLIYLGYGVLGGIGLGIGYISPVRTLMTWFPDRPGMATGLAIMGFGGGAMIASPLSVLLMHSYATPTDLGVAPAFVTLGVLYGVFMLLGAAIVRVPSNNWRPEGYVPKASASRLVTSGTVDVGTALRTPQFYLLWMVLFLNVTAGIGVISQASPMIQLLGVVLYASIPSIARLGSIAGFVLCYGIILSMYGGGFSTIPAYLKDMFGTRHVGAIHGCLLVAWSAAGVIGPVLVDYIRQYQISNGVAKADAYTITMYIMAGLLVLGAICNLLMSPVSERHLETTPAPAE